jgi:hypothetical protein
VSYEADQLRRVLQAGPDPDETFFRLRVAGAGAFGIEGGADTLSHWINITAEQLRQIIALLDD